jgi:hypothetical protein
MDLQLINLTEPTETREFEEGRFEVYKVGHDAWVVGDEPVVVVDWYGASNYAKGD